MSQDKLNASGLMGHCIGWDVMSNRLFDFSVVIRREPLVAARYDKVTPAFLSVVRDFYVSWDAAET